MEIINKYEEIARKTPMMKREYELEMIKNSQNGCSNSREVIVNSYLRTAISLSKKYCNKTNLELVDAIHESVAGINEAIDKFDVSKYQKLGSMFSYFAYRAILMRLGDFYRSNMRQFSVSDSTNLRLTNINKLYKQGLLNDKSPEETVDFVSKTLNIKPRETKMLIDLFKKPMELDAPISMGDNCDEDVEYKDLVLKTHESETPRSILEREDKKRLLMEAVNQLTADERNLVFHRYGIHCDESMTFAEIGEKYKISGQTVKNKIEKIQRNLKDCLIGQI